MQEKTCFRCNQSSDKFISVFCENCYNYMPYNTFHQLRQDRSEELKRSYSYPYHLNLIINILIIILIYYLFKDGQFLNILSIFIFYPFVNAIAKSIIIKKQVNAELPAQIAKEIKPEFRDKKSDIVFSDLINQVHSKYSKGDESKGDDSKGDDSKGDDSKEDESKEDESKEDESKGE